MCFLPGLAGLVGDFSPFSYAVLVPTSGLPELVPLLLEGLLGGRAGANLGLSNWPRDHRREGKLMLWHNSRCP